LCDKEKNEEKSEDEKRQEKQKAYDDKLIEEIKVAGHKVVETVKKLAKEVGVRRLIIKDQDGKTVMEIPLAVGAVGALISPLLAALSAAAALLTSCTIEVIRDKPKEEEKPEEETAKTE